MAEVASPRPLPVNQDDLRRLLVELRSVMVAAGDAVDNVEDSLRRIVDAYGMEQVQIALLPTSMFIEMGGGQASSMQFSSRVAPALRLDQIDDLHQLVKSLEQHQLTAAQGLGRLQEVYRRQATFGWPLRTLGHAVLTAGLALLLQPTPAGVAAALSWGCSLVC